MPERSSEDAEQVSKLTEAIIAAHLQSMTPEQRAALVGTVSDQNIEGFNELNRHHPNAAREVSERLERITRPRVKPWEQALGCIVALPVIPYVMVRNTIRVIRNRASS
jgi:hypothetical protein